MEQGILLDYFTQKLYEPLTCRYIEYEQALEELRDARRRQRGIGGPNTLADYCLPRRIHFIYDRLLRKFKGDLALWASWLRYCQATGAARQASRVLTRALRLHPTAPGMWAAAAAWEFEQGAGAAAARALMQQGLRMCGHVPGLWLEYLRMELLYAQRLRERRRVLGIMEAEAALGAEPGGSGQGAEHRPRLGLGWLHRRCGCCCCARLAAAQLAGFWCPA